ncbi:MAG: hypothetical protein HONBIEJF_02117 [Fimbriimonadaceae bacterium]|nr:hypothetical protein [Fimbriimonadaceae bacterium]
MAFTAVTASLAADVVYKEVKGQKEFTGTMIVRPRQDINSAAKLRARKKLNPYRLRYYVETDEFICKVPSGQTETEFANSLLKSRLYQYAQPNWKLYPIGAPNDPLYPNQWHHGAIKSTQAWDLHTGTDIVLAVTDTGVDTKHPDLIDLMVPGYNSPDDKAEVDGGDVSDPNGHGTHVAGCAGAQGDNGVGLAGVGWNFKIMPIRVAADAGGGATSEWLARGARWAVDNGAKVISASYSGVDDPNVETTGAYIRSKGAIYMYAAGNDNRNLGGFDHQNVIVVGATDQGDVKAGFSAYGRGVDIYAPGVNIWSTTPGGNYGPSSGTSMSTPVANGVASLIWSSNPNLDADQVQQILYETCEDLGEPGNDDYWGWGRVDAYEGVLRAISIEEPEKVLPNAAAVFVGSLIDGALANIIDVDGERYTVLTEYDPNLGDVAGLEAQFQLNRVPDELTRLEITVAAQASMKYVTGMLWAYNWDTGRYDHLKSFAVNPTLGNPVVVNLDENRLAKYISVSGQVRLATRGLMPLRRRAGSFTYFVDQLQLITYFKGN